MLQRPRSPRGNLCGAPVHTRGTMLTISFPELAQAQGLSLSQRNFDAVRQFYEPPNKPSVALDNILRSHRQTPWKLKRAIHLTSPSPRLARGNYRAHVCSEFVRIKVILAIKTVKSNRHLDVSRCCAASRRIVFTDPPRTKKRTHAVQKMDRYSITASAVASSDGRSLGGREIDRKVEPGRLLDGNIHRLKRGAPKGAGIFWAVRPSLPGHAASVSARTCDLQ